LTRRLKIGLAAAVAGVLVLLAAVWIAPLPLEITRPSSQVIEARDGTWLRVRTTSDRGGQWRIAVGFDELPEHLVQAVLTFEDRRFWSHPGVDPVALVRAAGQAIWHGRVVSGGSTITMQLARLIEPRRRTLWAKSVEMFRALQLELRYSKEALLVAYLHVAPYGGNIEGVGAASWFYFGKRVDQLALAEAAALAAIPNAPNQLRPDRGSDRLKARRDDVIARMAAAGVITVADAEDAKRVPVPSRRRRAPALAPHFTERVRRDHPEAPRLRTTLDPILQRRVEALLDNHVATVSAHGITNGAVVVLDNETAEVRAYLGSRRFDDASIDGQVDGAAASRSPGSTLKPFVYALALERGEIGLGSQLEDVPVEYQDWAPSNFDGRFRGLVSARDALAQSLNIPAVRLDEALQPEGLVALLTRAAVPTFVRRGGTYGLAAVLGGCEIDLLSLAGLYRALAAGGQYRRPAFVPSDDADRPLVSAASAFLISEVLTDVRRPDLPELWRHATSEHRLAWKTGTSYGRRDAWSVGYNKRWTVAVWLGNFDGRPAPELVGVRVAAPLLFSIVRVLPGIDDDAWISQPEQVVLRQVCSVSGQPASAHCPHTVDELAIESVAPRRRCRMHVRIDVDDDHRLRLCSRCRAGRAHHPEVHVQWPASAVPWLERAGVPVGTMPEHDPTCERGLDGEGPVIHTPANGDTFVLRPGVPPAHQQIAMSASTPAGAGDVMWFVDGALHARAQPGEVVLLDPVPGPHALIAVDPEGRSARVDIDILR